jgi:phospholipid/cholesterol/gamma-HCH transport system ATP-binding protein
MNDSAIVSINNLSKSFDDADVLRGISMEVKEGENVVVLGKSGSGKSTLIRCIIGLIDPDEGEIYAFGKNISTLTYGELNELRIKMGFLFQNGALYDSMTVRENLLFPLKHHKKYFPVKKQESLVREMLESIGLGDASEKTPAELSGGMSKRISLARTLVLKPSIMLYDEPTTGLDTSTSREISQLIIDMQKKNKISSIIITHDMACAKMTADRIVMLKEGLIVAQGTYDDLMKSEDEWIKSFFG